MTCENEQEMVTITKKEYDSLQDDALFLNCLQNAGVDNWCWYDTAVEEYRASKADEG